MKKLLSLLMAATLLVSSLLVLASCGSSASVEALKVIDIPLTTEEYAYAVAKGNTELLNTVNAFLAEIRSNGKFEDVLNKYFGDGTPTAVVSAARDESKAQLVVATNPAFAPFEYKEGDSYYGVDMEIMKLLADYMGVELVIDEMEFESVCTSVAQNKDDIAAAGLTVTDVRKETLDFSDSYYDAAQVLITKASDTTFDSCKTTEDVEAILKSKGAETKIGVQSSTTGHYYVSGSEDWGFEGFSVTCVPYEAAALAAQNVRNGNVNYVIVDIAPAKTIVAKLNAIG